MQVNSSSVQLTCYWWKCLGQQMWDTRYAMVNRCQIFLGCGIKHSKFTGKMKALGKTLHFARRLVVD